MVIMTLPSPPQTHTIYKFEKKSSPSLLHPSTIRYGRVSTASFYFDCFYWYVHLELKIHKFTYLLFLGAGGRLKYDLRKTFFLLSKIFPIILESGILDLVIKKRYDINSNERYYLSPSSYYVFRDWRHSLPPPRICTASLPWWGPEQ